VLLAAVLALAACSGSSSAKPSASSLSPAATESPSPSTSARPTIERSLLSGRVGAPNGPVLVVKLDNTQASNPWCGLRAADVIYLEQVEGGLSRYMAVFSSQYPKSVGPVRSARISDIELLRQYGKVAFAYSGVQTKMLPVLQNAYLIDVSDDRGGLGYHRDFSRTAPDNLFGAPSVLLKRAGHSALARNVGFSFGDAVPAGGTPAATLSTSYPATRVSFVWNAASRRWLASMNGARAMACESGQLGGTTVIIQYVKVTNSIYHDFLGNYTPMSTSVGTGSALILRNGMAWHATWSRPSAASGTRWLVGGRDFPLAAGQVWVLLINRNTPAKIG
jgi:hypothetical protein